MIKRQATSYETFARTQMKPTTTQQKATSHDSFARAQYDQMTKPKSTFTL